MRASKRCVRRDRKATMVKTLEAIDERVELSPFLVSHLMSRVATLPVKEISSFQLKI